MEYYPKNFAKKNDIAPTLGNHKKDILHRNGNGKANAKRR